MAKKKEKKKDPFAPIEVQELVLQLQKIAAEEPKAPVLTEGHSCHDCFGSVGGATLHRDDEGEPYVILNL